MTGSNLSPEEIKQRVSSIARENSKVERKIEELTALREGLGSRAGESSASMIDAAIEDVFGEELRRLNAIREKNLEKVNLQDIETLKAGFAVLFRLIDRTLHWDVGKQASLEGVINRASLRAMLIDPAVSVKTKGDIMNNWEDFM